VEGVLDVRPATSSLYKHVPRLGSPSSRETDRCTQSDRKTVRALRCTRPTAFANGKIGLEGQTGVKFTLPPCQRRCSWSGNPSEWAEMQIFSSFCVVPFNGKTGA